MKPYLTYKLWIPWALVYTRLLLAPVAIVIVLLELPGWIWLSQFVIAIFSDIYDGKLARRWHVASEKLRRADSLVDDIYAFSCLYCFWLAEPGIIQAHWFGIALVAGLELLRNPLDWYLFGKRASYHAWSTKTFGLSLIPVAFLIMGHGEVYWVLWLSLGIGILAELEGIAMSFILPEWTHDVKHLGRALSIRRQYSQA